MGNDRFYLVILFNRDLMNTKTFFLLLCRCCRCLVRVFYRISVAAIVVAVVETRQKSHLNWVTSPIQFHFSSIESHRNGKKEINSADEQIERQR